MTDFTIYTPDNAPEGSKELLKGFREKFGFDVNFFGVLAESPKALAAFPAIGAAFDQTTLSPAEQQVVLLATSVENNCRFCVAVHSTIGRNQAGVDGAVIDAVRENRAAPDAKLNALANFTKAIVEKRGFTDDEDKQAFLDAGYTKENIMEVILGVTYKTFTNYINHLMDTPLNDEFAPEAWDPGQKQAA
ncbi:MAG: hypothetical protein DHS20C02_15930 [Micavibrio sp.]|nr:MAG: hypothetical protein DHS20C02_15930 [Micavibrio sp.]